MYAVGLTDQGPFTFASSHPFIKFHWSCGNNDIAVLKSVYELVSFVALFHFCCRFFHPVCLPPPPTHIYKKQLTYFKSFFFLNAAGIFLLNFKKVGTYFCNTFQDLYKVTKNFLAETLSKENRRKTFQKYVFKDGCKK